MHRKLHILLLKFLLILPAFHLQAQTDSLPRLVKGRMDWKPYAARAPRRMNQKDYAVYMVRVNGLHEWFETEPDQSWINDFHFFDLNGDRIPDGFYSGPTKYYQGDHTMLMLGDSSLKYPVTFSEPGYLYSFTPSDSGVDMTLVKEASGLEYRTSVSRYFYSYAADSASKLWEAQYISTTELPPSRYPHQAFALHLPTYLRTSPEIRNEPGVDYDQDGRPDGLGNIVAELKAGMPLFRVWEESRGGMNWSFVMVMAAPENSPLFPPVGKAKWPIARCGWIPSEALGL
jgi:hypothetical protein